MRRRGEDQTDPARLDATCTISWRLGSEHFFGKHSTLAANAMNKAIPPETIDTFARTIFREARNYGFGQLDFIRLVNALLDFPDDGTHEQPAREAEGTEPRGPVHINTFPLRSDRLSIRLSNASIDFDLLSRWIDDEYGRHFLLSSSTAQSTNLDDLLENPQNKVGIVLEDGEPIGAVAYLDIDAKQRRAELRKLIGQKSARGKGFAEEATRLWIRYGIESLGLEKIYVSTLQTHLRNIQLNESIGFRVEGVLQREVLIDGERYDVLRMGLCFDDYCRGPNGGDTGQ